MTAKIIFFWLKKWYFYVIIAAASIIDLTTSEMTTSTEYAGALFGNFIFYGIIFTFIGVILALVNLGTKKKKSVLA